MDATAGLEVCWDGGGGKGAQLRVQREANRSHPPYSTGPQSDDAAKKNIFLMFAAR